MRFFGKSMKLGLVVSALALLGAWAVLGQNAGDPILSGFQNPPDSAKPRVWWHWMNGQVSKEGIKLDLEWMKRVGIGGFQNFDGGGMGRGAPVSNPVLFLSPEWKDAFHYAATLADQLDLEMTRASSPGWSETGGPWVEPAQAMKKFVWTETRIEGGQPFNGKLAAPPDVTGPFQNRAGSGNAQGADQISPYGPWYADAAVIAFRLPDSDKTLAQLNPRVTSSGGDFTLAALTDGDYVETTMLPPADVGQKSWIQFEFAEPQTVYGMSFYTGSSGRGFGPGGGGASNQALEVSDNGQDFRVVAPYPGGQTFSLPTPVTSRFFRFTVLASEPPSQTNTGGFGGARGAGRGQGGAGGAPAGTAIAEFALYTSAHVNRAEDKAAFGRSSGMDNYPTPQFPDNSVINKADVIDLTAQMQPDGTLNWTPPPGNWGVLRLGYSLLGAFNRPAPPEATGLEADKLSKEHMTAYYTYYLGQLKDAAGAAMGQRGLQYILNDSWEAGQANWTDNMMELFAEHRSYDMTPWLPVLVGHVVESSEASDRFLWDFRTTIAELTAENNYDLLGTMAKELGMKGRYSEGHETGRVYIADGMDVKRNADIPMSAMWAVNAEGVGSPWGGAMDENGHFQRSYAADSQGSASVAHIYGQNIVAAESLTGGAAYSWYPELLKPTADAEMAFGINRFVIHTSAHQATEDLPGITLGVGQWFTRHETWAELARPWTTYLSRSCFMLQQGVFGADILYYYGGDANVSSLFGQEHPAIPEGYPFDYANADVVVNRITSAGGRLTTTTGMSYRMLVLDENARRNTPLPVLRKIRDYVHTGAVVVGPKPIASPSNADDQAEFQRIADELWGSGSGERTVGEGKVFAGMTIAEAVRALNIQPDFEYVKPQPDTLLMFVHRKVSDGEIYWVNNRHDREENVDATFRVTGKAPELWHADTGVIEPVSYRIVNGRTVVPLRLNGNDAVFVVFRKPATAQSLTVPDKTETQLATVEGSWTVAFQPDRGAPAQVMFDDLASWTENSDPGVKYFSGVAAYSKTIQAPDAWFNSGAEIWLDLGDVKDIAEVAVNGELVAGAWRKPFRVNVTDALKAGANTLEVKVANVWVNRMIGDQQPGATQITSTQSYQADSPLLPSGLLGPVRLVSRSN